MVTIAAPRDLEVLTAAIATPIDSDERVNYSALESLAAYYVDRGIEGIYCCGSSGEGLLLTDDERARVVKTVADAVSGRAPVIAHVGSLSTRAAISLAEQAQQDGASAVSMIPPIYYSYSGEAITAHYRAVMDAIDIPMIVYNIPQFTGTEFTTSSASDLLSDPRVIGLKQTSHNMFALEQMKSAFPDKAYINGFDEVFVSAMAAGAKGTIGTTVGLQLELFVAARERFEAGDMTGARRVQSRINEVVAELVAIDVFPAAKYLSGKRSIGSLGDCRRPFLPISGKSCQQLDRLSDRIDEFIALTASEDSVDCRPSP